MAVREQTVQDLATTVAERWRTRKSYDRKSFKTMVREAIRGRGITDQNDANELLKRVADECAKRSASHSKANAAARKSA